ncbi:MAG: UvrD-helicase domain-containing protein [Xanthomonadales bacterium]|nr:UvrD-helicase domain-containing protein [Xanthomonadales bacterium]
MTTSLPVDIAVDVGLHLPLHGARLIEASAGTGKTFTLATLVLRLLLERGASMSQMLAVTFTRAATQELRQRLRRRLRLARRLLDTPEAALQGEAAMTDAVLQSAIQRDGITVVRQRIEAALLQLDEATVSTIHGFCHRALREFGFRAGLLAEQAVVDDATEVWSDVAAELWRAAANTDATVFDAAVVADVHDLLAALWQAPDALTEDLPALCDPLRVVHPLREESIAAAALHALRDAAIARFDTAMARRSECSQDQLIERVWKASAAPEFAAALAARWPLMLIDEFQDTDPRQWDIFRRMYEAGDPDARWLCLIGDPKQAIYRFRGGDLATYRRARDHVVADAGDGTRGIAELDANFRSTPAVLRAIETMFTANPLPFVDDIIAFHSVIAAGGARDDDLRVGDAVVPGMTVHWLPPGEGRGGMRTKDDEFAMMRDAAVRAVVELLSNGRFMVAGGTRALRPSEIAVLTNTNDQALTMQAALTRAGVAAALLSSASVFASDAAEDLHALLASLVEPGDGGRFRAALATRLLGWDAARIAALDEDDGLAQSTGQNAGQNTGQNQLERFTSAADQWRARGPLPALLPFIADAAPRWLAETTGARRLTDALHLAELLQAESSSRHGMAEQLQWFAMQRANAAADEARQLRLESDAGLVQIATVHKSKGLEYPVVILPFVAWRSEPGARGLSYEDFHDAQGRPARAWRCKDVLAPAQADAIAVQVEREEQAEAQRQLYVAMTRAKHALHVVWSRNSRTETSALHWLLHAGAKTGRKNDALDHAGMQARIEALAADSGGSIVVRAFDPAAPRTRLHGLSDAESVDVPPARIARRRFSTDPRLQSFSSLHARSEDGEILRGADDEVVAIPDEEVEVISLGGTAFGNAVHQALETADAPLWSREAEAQSSLLEDRWPQSQRAVLEHALLRHGLAATPAHLAQTARLVSRALNVSLPGGVRLCELPASQQVREMAFHFRLRPTRIDAVHALLQAHGYPRARKPAQTTLDGLMQGYIDLVYRDPAGRHYVLDYKTNRLPAYDPDSLRRAIRTQDYDLQYLIYLVALRRWLKLRRGATYDDARDLGGAVYLFMRGIRLHDEVGDVSQSRAGVHVDAVAPTLLAELDALFDGMDATAGMSR